MSDIVPELQDDSKLHLHVISMHTSPLAQPGRGDAGGMNVYIDRSLRALLAARPSLSVEIFTLVREPVKVTRQQVSERAVVHFVEVPAAFGAEKSALPLFVEDFASEVSKVALRAPDIVHSHYWLSGLAALEYASSVPLVHTMHTTAAAKDARAGADEPHEPEIRYAGEQRIVRECSALVVNTEVERAQMERYYSADPNKIFMIEPGVDTGIFKPLAGISAKNAGSNSRIHMVFAGRPQPLKGPQIAVEALGLIPKDLTVTLSIIGQSGTDFEQSLMRRVDDLGLSSRVELLPPVPPRELAQIFRTADVVVCPSSSETFGLVALEAQACGTPVIATDADGLSAAVAHGQSGILVRNRKPASWAIAIELLTRVPGLRAKLGSFAAVRASQKNWNKTAEELWNLYTHLVDSSRPLT